MDQFFVSTFMFSQSTLTSSQAGIVIGSVSSFFFQISNIHTHTHTYKHNIPTQIMNSTKNSKSKALVALEPKPTKPAICSPVDDHNDADCFAFEFAHANTSLQSLNGAGIIEFGR